ncbi:MAG: DNA repair putative endonuclease MmcB [Hyphomonadaceae bacterium]
MIALTRPETTQFVIRGVCRLLIDHGYAPLMELPLGNGRRADVAALGPAGEILIVECKSCFEDYRVDEKWGEYAPYCDAFYFAVTEDFPVGVLPEDVGLIIADRFSGAFLRPAAEQPALAPARRRSMLLSFARLAALRACA